MRIGWQQHHGAERYPSALRGRPALAAAPPDIPDAAATAPGAPASNTAPTEPDATPVAPGTPAETETTPEDMLAALLREQEALLAALREKVDEMAFTSSSYKERFAGVNVQKPKDNAAALTARLVMAGTVFQVLSIAAEAGSSLTSLRAAAAMGKGETAQLARACIARLEKLIVRCRRKMRSLDDEAVTQRSQKRAEEENRQKKAERIKQELRRKRITRAARENAWLQDANKGGAQGSTRPADRIWDVQEQRQLEQAIELAISAEAAAMAAAEVATEAAAPGGEAAIAVEGGGAEGMDAGGEASGGGMDISV